MAGEYDIKTINDFLIVPTDRIDACLSEFCCFIKAIQPAKKMVKVDRFQWIDDGKEDVTITVTGGK